VVVDPAKAPELDYSNSYTVVVKGSAFAAVAGWRGGGA